MQHYLVYMLVYLKVVSYPYNIIPVGQKNRLVGQKTPPAAAFSLAGDILYTRVVLPIRQGGPIRKSP